MQATIVSFLCIWLNSSCVSTDLPYWIWHSCIIERPPDPEGRRNMENRCGDLFLSPAARTTYHSALSTPPTLPPCQSDTCCEFKARQNLESPLWIKEHRPSVQPQKKNKKKKQAEVRRRCSLWLSGEGSKSFLACHTWSVKMTMTMSVCQERRRNLLFFCAIHGKQT